MPRNAREVLSIAARRAETLGDVSRDSEGYWRCLARSIRWFIGGAHAVDTQSSSVLRTYKLRTPHKRKNGDLHQAQIGVFVGNADLARFHKGSRIPPIEALMRYGEIPKPHFRRSRAANSLYVGFFEVRVPEGYKQSDLHWKWLNGEPHDKPQAEWIPSSLFGQAALDGNPPVEIVLHHDHHGNAGFATQIIDEDELKKHIGNGTEQVRLRGRLPDTVFETRWVDAEKLAKWLLEDRFMKSTLKAHPESDLLLNACGVTEPEAQTIANKVGRKLHYGTGLITLTDSYALEDAVRDNSVLPFAVTDDALQAFNKSLDNAPQELKDVADRMYKDGDELRKYGWSAFAAWRDADSRVPPIQTVTPR